MADRSGDDAETATVEDASQPSESDADPLPDDLDDAGVDEAVKRRLREAYLNDEDRRSKTGSARTSTTSKRRSTISTTTWRS